LLAAAAAAAANLWQIESRGRRAFNSLIMAPAESALNYVAAFGAAVLCALHSGWPAARLRVQSRNWGFARRGAARRGEGRAAG